jgi:hypothetical protein
MPELQQGQAAVTAGIIMLWLSPACKSACTVLSEQQCMQRAFLVCNRNLQSRGARHNSLLTYLLSYPHCMTLKGSLTGAHQNPALFLFALVHSCDLHPSVLVGACLRLGMTSGIMHLLSKWLASDPDQLLA